MTAGLPLARKTKKLITQLSHLTNEQIYAAWVNRRFFIKALIYHGALKRSTAKVELQYFEHGSVNKKPHLCRDLPKFS